MRAFSLVALATLAFLATSAFAGPLKVLRNDADAFVVEMRVPKPTFRKVLRQGIAYEEIRLEGFDQATEPGHPEVPYLDTRVVVPPGKEVSHHVEYLAAAPLLTLQSDIAFAERLPFHDGKPAYAMRDAPAYEKTYGDSVVEMQEVSYAARDRMAVIRLWPLRYDAKQRTLSLSPAVKIHFGFKKARTITKAPVSGQGNSVAAYVALNGEQKAFYAPKVDLIISHVSHQQTVSRLAEFKRSEGREVRELYVSGKTTTEIKEIIRQQYKSGSPPTSTLLVGNIDQIPAWAGSNDNKKTDFPYSALDDGSMPDISLGRVPAHSIEELRNFIDKAIAREIEPRDVDQILLTAGADTSLGCPANVTKVGDKFKPAASTINLVKKFKINVGTQDIIDAYNANPNIIVYDGHGNQSGMTEVPLLISGLNQLKNRTFPLVLDIACLNAHWSSSATPRNFAEMILLQQGAGVAGIMASGGSGYGHDFFQTIASIMATARQNLGSDPKMNEIGQVILAAKIKHGTQDRTYWNYYGDPASSVWE